MKRNRWILIATAVIASASLAQADTFTFTASSGSVNYAINADGTGSFLGAGYYESSSGVFDGSSAVSEPSGGNYLLAADSASYADAGIVLFFNGSLTLKELGSVSIVSTGSPLSVNLWLDTSGDDQFFAFNGTYFDNSHKLTSLNGDDYYGSTSTYGPGVSSLNGTASFSALTGGEPAGSYTLAQFQNGDVPGISGNTPVALWIGLSSTSSANSFADIQSITVTTNPVPLPASAWSGLGLLGGLGLFSTLKRIRRQMA